MASTVTCPSCGSQVEINDPEMAKMKYCNQCGASIDLTTNTAKKPFQRENQVLSPKSDLKLGSTGNINDVNYRVVGRIRYRDVRTYEWWDEWLLLSESGQYLWMQEDDWDFTLMNKFTPQTPFDPNTVGQYLDIDGNHLEVEDNSSAVILFIEGELTWKADIGETIRYIDAWKGEDTLYSCEWTDREIVYFVGKDIHVNDIYKAFKLGNPPAAALKEDKEIDWSENPFQRMVKKLINGPAFKFCLIFGILSMITAIFVLAFGTPVYSLSGNKVMKEGKSFIYGPYNFTKKNRVYRIDSKYRTNNNSALYCEISILSDQKDMIFGWDGDYWHESGYDSDGSWQESNSKKVTYFNLKEPGKYYFEVTPERDVPDFASRFKLSIKEGVIYNWPFWRMAIFLLIYPGIVLVLWVISHSGESDD
ncbi:MAG: DUF4178 domain-containing protein [Candidatus Eremiobacteraeota bacterium]|nr:DUF4178 domain-containing protein [Candidatus Eremiobacteraeota bacterium]